MVLMADTDLVRCLGVVAWKEKSLGWQKIKGRSCRRWLVMVCYWGG